MVKGLILEPWAFSSNQVGFFAVNRSLVAVVLLLLALSGAFYCLIDDGVVEEIDEVAITTEDPGNSTEVRRYSSIPRKSAEVAEGGKENYSDLPQFRFANDSTLTADNSTVMWVVGKKTGTGIPDAVVTVLSQDEYDNHDGEEKVRQDPFDFFSKHGRHFRTDKNGQVRVPDLSGEVMIAGMTKDRIYYLSAEAPLPLRLILSLSPAIDVRARVVNPQGHLVPETKVQLFVRYFGGMNGGETWHSPLSFGVTNEKGLAHLRVPEYLILGATRHRLRAQLRLGIEGFLQSAKTAKFDPKEPPQGVVELELPGYGGFEVAIQNVDGSPCEKPLKVLIAIHQDGQKLTSFFATRRAIVSQETTTGKVFWPKLPCGLRYDVTVMGEMIRNKPMTQVFEGPALPRSIARRTFRFTWKAPVLRGQLRTPDGQFLKKQKLRLRMTTIYATTSGNRNQSRSSGSDYYRTSTDGEGRFEVDLQAYSKRSPFFARHLKMTTAGRKGLGPLLKRLRIAQLGRQDDVDLGIVTLDEAELLVSGRVVDVHGGPIYRARFHAEFDGQDSGGEPSLFATEIRRIRTRRDGAFAIYGSFGSNSLSLKSFAQKYLDKQVVVQQPTSDLILTLPKPALLRGRIVFSNGLSSSGLVVRLLALGETKLKSIKVQVAKDGEFVARDLRPGDYRLVVAPHESRSNLLLDLPLSLVDGQHLDLNEVRIKFAGARLDLVTVDPPKIKVGLLISVCEPGTAKEVTRFVLTKNKETLYIPIPVCDLHLTTAGYRQTVMKNVTSGKVELRMKPGLPVTFEFVNPEILPEGYEVNFYVDPNLGTGPFWLRNMGPRHREPFHSPGRFSMSARIAHVGNRGKTVRVPVSPPFVHVLDKIGPQLFKLSLSQDDVDDVIRRLKP